jgi:hypothetical protein
MFRRFASPLIVFAVLMPPGICPCEASARFVQLWSPSQFLDDSDKAAVPEPAPTPPDHDHDPNCPSHDPPELRTGVFFLAFLAIDSPAYVGPIELERSASSIIAANVEHVSRSGEPPPIYVSNCTFLF